MTNKIRKILNEIKDEKISSLYSSINKKQISIKSELTDLFELINKTEDKEVNDLMSSKFLDLNNALVFFSTVLLKNKERI